MKTATMQRRLPLTHVIALVLTTVVAGGALALARDVERSRAAADQFLRKMATIETNATTAQRAARRTAVTETELNSFLAFHARSEIPAGVMDPTVSIDEAGRLSGKATVDLDEVRKAQAQRGDGGFSVLSMLSGRMPVEATGVLSTHDGVGQFTLETATVNGVPVPKAMLQQLVNYYSKTEETPDGVNLDAPFPLPAGIREIQTQRGQAVIVQ